MPKQAEIGLPQRARQYHVAWERIGKAFPELKIWLIDMENETYKRTDWGECLSRLRIIDARKMEKLLFNLGFERVCQKGKHVFTPALL